MLSKKILTAISEQIKWEFFSAYLYVSMSSYFENNGLKGHSSWMKVQAQEELTHAMKFFNYVCDRGEKVDLLPIDGPRTEWRSSLDAFEDTLKHEQEVTAKINAIATLAMQESDHATLNMLQWFIAEQVEEESSAQDVIDQLKIIKDSPEALLLLDRELATRVFVMPPANGQGA